ncbi:endolytic transglycosylase MltG [Patescibacteria group bacterium]|nr:endolytic transglycosylase MltG [Patescibacteria group bacterium]
MYEVKPGETYTKTAHGLADMGAIRSPYWFKTFVYIFSLANRKTLAGDYALAKPENVLVLAWRFSHGDFDIAPVRVTIPEGSSAAEESAILAKALKDFKSDDFLAGIKSGNLEGYLFPDTYLFLPNATASDTIGLMRQTFDEKTAPLEGAIATSGHPLADIVAMASVLEGEARTDSDMKLIAGILWKRLSIGMPLQVDSAPETYQKRGLPAPIGNPGLSAITDALYPTPSKYLYFISDKQGNIHYAKTLNEQNTNVAKYLK